MINYVKKEYKSTEYIHRCNKGSYTPSAWVDGLQGPLIWKVAEVSNCRWCPFCGDALPTNPDDERFKEEA